jgi:hypothetical protein
MKENNRNTTKNHMRCAQKIPEMREQSSSASITLGVV